MAFYCLGVSHREAALDKRETLRLPDVRLVSLLRMLRELAGLDEALILSTCHRFELYAATTADSVLENGWRELAAFVGDETPARESWRLRKNGEAVRHLFRVASGLDSVVPGDAQILGQVKDAYRLACQAGTSGFYTSACFHRAFRVGKRSRSETGLGNGCTSTGSAAVEKAEVECGLADKRVLVVGAGDIGRLVLRAVRTKNPAAVTLANRSTSGGHIFHLSCEYGAKVIGLEGLSAAVRQHDVIFSATSAPHVLITADMVSSSSPLWLFDLAVPRDIDPQVGNMPGVRLWTVDDLAPCRASTLALRRGEIPRAEEIVKEALAEYEVWNRELAAVPSIRRILELADRALEDEGRRIAETLSGDVLTDVLRGQRRMVRDLMRTIIEELKATARDSADRMD